MSEDESSGGGGNVFQRIASLLLINRFRGDSGIGFNRAATWVAMISAIMGGYVGLSTYQLDVSKQVDQSVEKSFEMIQAYNSSDLTDARARVMSYVHAKRQCDARYINRELTQADHIRVLEFFDLVYACIEADLCDDAAARRFFTPHASFQWPILSEVVDAMRSSEQANYAVRSDPNFAVGMAALAAPDSSAPPCDGNF